MSTRGRKPKPTALRVIEGNPGKRPLNKREPKPQGGTTPPAVLDARARAEWKRLARKLEPLGLLTAADRVPFALYCQSWSDYCELVLAIREATAEATEAVQKLRADLEKAAEQARAAGIPMPDMLAGVPGVPRLAGLLAVGKDGVFKTHPFVAQRNALMRVILSASGEFGFTPSARTRLKAPEEKPKTRLQEAREAALAKARERAAKRRSEAAAAPAPDGGDE